ncbi:MAG: PKD domain-containing protein [Thermoplasmata archaeon]
MRVYCKKCGWKLHKVFSIIVIAWTFSGLLFGSTLFNGTLSKVEAANPSPFVILTGGNVTPPVGNVTAPFNYTINYTHTNNERPDELYISIGENDYDMKEVNESDTNYSDGKAYYFEKLLPRGNHNYSFTASDIYGNTNFTQTFTGPSVNIDTMNNVLVVFGSTGYAGFFRKVIEDNMTTLLDRGINVTMADDVNPKNLGNYSVIVVDQTATINSGKLEILKRYLESGNGIVLLGDTNALKVPGADTDTMKTWFGAGTTSMRFSSGTTTNGTATISTDRPFGCALSIGDIVFNEANPYTYRSPAQVSAGDLSSTVTTIARWGGDNKTFAYKHTYGSGRVFYLSTNLICIYTIEDEEVKNNLTDLFVAGTSWASNIENQLIKPDFIPTKIELSKETPSENEEITVNFTIKNQGTAPGTVNIVAHDESSDGRVVLSPESNYVRINSSENRTFSCQWTPAKGGNHNITVEIDLDYEVSESNKSNNVLSRGVYVNTPPQIGSMAEFDNKKALYGKPVTFTCAAEDDSGLSDSSYIWSSDKSGRIGTGTSVTVSNLSVGKHKITLTVTDDYSISTNASINLTIIDLSALPVVKITAPLDNGVYTNMENIQFTCTATKGTLPYSYTWKMNNNNVSDSQNFEKSNLTPGKYEISVSIHDADNFSSDDKINIEVIEQTGFIWISDLNTSSGDWNTTEDESSYSIFVSVYNNGSYTETIKLLLNDDIQRTQEQSLSIPSKTSGTTEFEWSSPYSGSHRVTIQVMRGISILDTKDKLIGVMNQVPTAQIRFMKTDGSSVQQIYEGDTISLDAKGSSDTTFDRTCLICTWESDGVIIRDKVSINESIPWKFQKPGSYSIKLTVKDDNNAMNTATTSITVLNRPPVAVAGEDTTVYVGDPVLFYGKGTDPSEEPWMLKYHWDLGDKTTSSEMNPTHRYKEPGVYPATLTVTDSYGLSSTSTATITVTKVDKHLLVSIISPGDRTAIKQNTVIKVSTTDTAEKVQIYINGAIFSEFKQPPYEISWDTTTGAYPNGKYTISVTVSDSTTAEKVATSEVVTYVENPTAAPEAVVAATIVGTATAVGSATVLSGTVATAGVGKLSMFISKIKDWASQYGGQYTEDVLKEKADQKVKIEGTQGLASGTVLASIFISIVVIVIFYSFVDSGGIFNFSAGGFIDAIPETFIASAIVIIVIELVVAFSAGISNLRFGYKNWPGGIFALGISSLLMMPFGMPGRSIINKEKTSERTIAAIGVSKSSIILSFALLFAVMMEFGGTFYTIGESGMGTSLMLFMYTVLPFRVIEGGDIYKWNKAIWAGLFTLSILLFYGWELSFLPHAAYLLAGTLGVVALSYTMAYQVKGVRGYVIGGPSAFSYADMMIDPYGRKKRLREKKNLFVFDDSEFGQLSETPYSAGETVYAPPIPETAPSLAAVEKEQQAPKEEPNEVSPYGEEKPTKWVVPYVKKEKGAEGDEWLEM